MYKKIPGGKEFKFGQHTVHLPPIGYTPNFIEGKPEELVECTILNESQSTSQQKWRRPELPKDWKKLRADEEKLKLRDPEYVDPICNSIRLREWTRRLNGIWVKVNGEFVYLTGLHYYYLNSKLDFGYPDFRFVDLKIFYLLQLADEDPNCFGVLLATLRRFGKTAQLGTWLLELPTRMKNCYVGLQSKTGDDAKKVFELSIVNVWRNSNDFYKPVYDYNSGQKKEINFVRPTQKGKKALLDEEFGSDELQSKITYKNTVANAYDGWKLHRIGLEEPGKWEDVSVYDTWKIIKPCLLVKGEVVGKAFLPTTINEMDKGGKDFKLLWDESDLTKKNKNGRTTSGLYRLFISADEGYKFDDYGRSLVKESRQEILNERESLQNDVRGLSEYIRQFPLDEAEAFRFGGKQCQFNRLVIEEALQKCQLYKSDWIRIGRFVWSGGIKDGKVIWQDDPDGPWHISLLLDTEATGPSNLVVRNGGYCRPLNTIRYVFSLDPISHGKLEIVNERDASYVGSTGFRKFDMWVDPDPSFKLDNHGRSAWESHSFIADYRSRPDDPEEAYEDMICACVYYGCQILGESQKIAWNSYFIRRGYGAFVMNRPDEAKSQQGNQGTPGMPSSKEIITLYTSKIKTYVQHHGHRVKHERILNDWLEFDPMNTQKYDLSVASGFNLVAADQPVVEEKQSIKLESLITIYDQSGNQSE